MIPKARTLLLAAFALSLLLATTTHAAQPTPKPNIVLILCDDLGIGDVQSLNPKRGKIPTPHIDKLAAEGMSFTDAHSTSSLCTPSRYALLTGRYAWRTRLQFSAFEPDATPLISQDRLTLPEFLKSQGYTTAIFGKWHLGLTFATPNGPERFASRITDGPLQHGFDQFFGLIASLDMPPFVWIDNDRLPELPTTRKTWVRPGPAAPSFQAIDVLPKLTDKATTFIRDHAKPTPPKSPYFLYLPLAAPHAPLLPTPEWKGKSGLGDYADFVMQTDATLGAILKAIDDAGQRDNTVVIFTSDNGFALAGDPRHLQSRGHFPSADYRGYKSDLWDGGHRVPLVIRWPGFTPPNSTSDSLVSLVDVFATVADHLGQSLPETAAVDSISFLPLLKGSTTPTRTTDVQHSGEGYFAFREGKWKLLLAAGSGGTSAPREPKALADGLPEVQLYDLSQDPSETKNLQAQHPDVVTRLRSCLEEALHNGRITPGLPQTNDVPVILHKKPTPPKPQAR